MTATNIVAIATVVVLVAGPLLLGLAGCVHAYRVSSGSDALVAAPWSWKLTIISALLCTLAFNLTFFIQELFLVLPKALTPGLRPTLFHNNHHWEGHDPLASLLQGTGALAIFVTGCVCALLLSRRRGASLSVRLFLFWMAYCGLFMALPQVVVGAVSSQSDVGMAMTYLNLNASTKTAAALLALAAIPLAAFWLRRCLFGLAADATEIAGAKARTLFVFRIVALPALVAMPLIVLFRVPREWIEVVMVPAVVIVIGCVWLQAGAWIASDARPAGRSHEASIAWPLAAVMALLAIFQLVLRPGIAFY